MGREAKAFPEQNHFLVFDANEDNERRWFVCARAQQCYVFFFFVHNLFSLVSHQFSWGKFRRTQIKVYLVWRSEKKTKITTLNEVLTQQWRRKCYFQPNWIRPYRQILFVPRSLTLLNRELKYQLQGKSNPSPNWKGKHWRKHKQNVLIRTTQWWII